MKKLGIMAAAAAALATCMGVHAPQPTIKSNTKTRIENATRQQSDAQRSMSTNALKVTQYAGMDVKYLLDGYASGFRSYDTHPYIYGRYLLMSGKNKYNDRRAKHYAKTNHV